MFSDHDNLTNAAAAAPAPESETVPNNAHTETNSTVENAPQQTALPAATEPTEATSAAPESPATGTAGADRRVCRCDSRLCPCRD